MDVGVLESGDAEVALDDAPRTEVRPGEVDLALSGPVG